MTDSSAPERATTESLRPPPQAAPPPPAPRGLAARAWSVIAIPLAAVALALVVGSVIILLSSFFAAGGFDPALPLVTYRALFVGAFGSLRGLENTVVTAAPLVFGGLAVGIGFKGGLFNIGAQGQFLVGALASAVVGAALATSPGPVAMTAAVAAGILAGAVWGFIPGVLKAATGAHEVVSTIMLNFIAAALVGYLINTYFMTPAEGFASTDDVGNAALPVLFGARGHIGLVLALLAVPAAWWVLWRSTLGFEIRTVGANPNAARYAGMRPGMLIVLTLTLCGALAGLAGANQILGISHSMNASYGSNIGFDSISVALLGRAHPVGILLAALLFGALRAGAGLMQIEANIPIEIIDVIQAIILLFLAADILVRRLLRLRAARAGVDELQTVTRSYGEQAAH